MRVLLSEGSGLTSRQVATRLGELGHQVELLSSSRLCLGRFTRHVRRVHRVPPFGARPLAWLEAASRVAVRRRVDLLFPTQEQVTVLSACEARLPMATLVPPFSALRRVQDKVSAWLTLRDLGLPQPPAWVLRPGAAPAEELTFPVHVKRPVGTASTGVRRAEDRSELERAVRALAGPGEELLLQAHVPGPLVMVQALADRGRLVAWHATRRVREGAQGGASSKESVRVPGLEVQLRALVGGLGWHGPLSLDAILGAEGPVTIDVNPRLVEPRNALLAGVDLVALSISIARGEHPPPRAPGRRGVRSHQLVLAELRAAQQGRGAVLRELLEAVAGIGPYRDSTEELTPARGDLLALVPPAAIALATLVAPESWRRFAGASVGAYALTPEAWAQLVAGG